MICALLETAVGEDKMAGSGSLGQATNQATADVMTEVQVVEWCTKVTSLLLDLPGKFEKKVTKEDGAVWANEQIAALRDGLGGIQVTIVKLLAARIDKLPTQLEAGIRAASKSTVDGVTASFQATMSTNSRPTMADIVKRNTNVLILKPADGDQTVHRKSNRELTELGNVMRAALGPTTNQVKLGGIHATANNGAVCEFATVEDRDEAKAALERCTDVTKYLVSLPRKPQVVIKFVPQETTEEELLEAIAKCPGVEVDDCKVIKQLGKDTQPTRPYLVEVSKQGKAMLLMKKHLMVNGFSRCLVEEKSNQCFACYGFGHIAASCKLQRCGKCSSVEHQTKDCTSQIMKCCNCLNKKIDGPAHAAFQTWLCPVAKSSISSVPRQLSLVKNGGRAQAR